MSSSKFYLFNIVTHSSSDFYFEEYPVSLDEISTVVASCLVVFGKPVRGEIISSVHITFIRQ